MNLRKHALVFLVFLLDLLGSSASASAELTVTIYNVPYRDICGKPLFENCAQIRNSRLDRDFLSEFERKKYDKQIFTVSNGILKISGTTLGKLASKYHYDGGTNRIAFVVIDIPPPSGERIYLQRKTNEDEIPHYTFLLSSVGRLATFYDLRKIAVEVEPKLTLGVDAVFWDFEIR